MSNGQNLLRTIFLLILSMLPQYANALTAEESRVKLIGEWQVGLNVNTKGMPYQTAFRTGLLGPIWRFNPDNTLDVYLPCDVSVPIDRKITKLTKKEIQVAGIWRLEADGMLYIALAETINPIRKVEERGVLLFDQYPSVKLGEGTMTIKTGIDKRKQFGRFKEGEVNCN